MDGRQQKQQFVEKVEEFKKNQKDPRVIDAIQQYCLYYLRLRHVINSDLPADTLDDVRGRVEYFWWESVRAARVPQPRPITRCPSKNRLGLQCVLREEHVGKHIV